MLPFSFVFFIRFRRSLLMLRGLTDEWELALIFLMLQSLFVCLIHLQFFVLQVAVCDVFAVLQAVVSIVRVGHCLKFEHLIFNLCLHIC